MSNAGGKDRFVRLLQQPDDGATPLLHAINNAKSSIDILIFRFDHPEIEKALAGAARRGVAVRALIAEMNSSGRDSLRKLEMRLLGAGVTVARTGGDFARYHAKLLVIDQCELYLLAFNFTKLDINRSRSFGLVLQDPKLVSEALRLIEADTKRQPYQPGSAAFIVSPENARERLGEFIEGAKKELLIYDPKVGDPAMLRLLRARAQAKVEIRVIGQVTPATEGIDARRLPSPRLHTRAIVRDREAMFIGSQSLREMELDRRREAGVIVHSAELAEKVIRVFEGDWEVSKPPERGKDAPAGKEDAPPLSKLAKRVAKAMAKDLPPVTPVLEGTMRELGAAGQALALDQELIEEAVRDAVKVAIQEAVQEAVQDALEDGTPQVAK